MFADQQRGAKQSLLRRWLRGETDLVVMHGADTGIPCSIQLRGMAIAVSREQVLQIGRQALHNRIAGSDAFQSWYVALDGRRVAIKWLVSQVSGLPVSAFTSDEARRVLRQLGIEVWSV